jgi:hypothetical protein
VFQIYDSSTIMDQQNNFERFKTHLKDNVYAVLWSAWLRKDKSGLTEIQCQIILDKFVHAFFIMASLQTDTPNDFRMFLQIIDEIRILIE